MPYDGIRLLTVQALSIFLATSLLQENLTSVNIVPSLTPAPPHTDLLFLD